MDGCSGAEARQVAEVQASKEGTSESQCGEAAFCTAYSKISAWSSHWPAHQLHVTTPFLLPPDLLLLLHFWILKPNDG